MDKTYYQEMLKRERLIPFFVRCYDKETKTDYDKLICFISFFITNNPERYIQRDNLWTFLDDEPETGKIAYIDQIWSDKKAHNYRYSFEVWDRLVKFIKLNFPKVEEIYWHRWKNGKLFVYKQKLKKER